MNKFLLGIFALLVIPFSVMANGEQEEAASANGPAELRVTVWSGNAAHLEMLNGFADAYIAAKDDIFHVEFETIPFGEYVTKLTLQLAGSNPPDIGWLLETSAPTFLDSGVLKEIGSTLKADESYDFTDFSEPALDLWVKGDEVYGIPFSTSPFLVFYNVDLFKAAGAPTPKELMAAGSWTWESFKESAKIVKNKTGKYAFQTINGAGFDARLWNTLGPILRAYGTDSWDKANNVLINSPEAKSAIAMYHSMIFEDQSIVPPGALDDFYAGDAASTVTQISRIPKLMDADFEWDIAPLPAGPAGHARVSGQAALSVFQSSKNADAAVNFLAFMTNKENVTTMSQFFPPARKSVLSSEAFRNNNPALMDENFEILIDGIENGFVLSAHKNFPKIDMISRGIFDELWNPDADVNAVLDKVADSIEPLM